MKREGSGSKPQTAAIGALKDEGVCTSEATALAIIEDIATELQSRPPLDNTVNYAGRLSVFYNQWSQITADKIILSWIRGYEIPFTETPYQHCIPQPRNYAHSEKLEFDQAIHNLISIGAIPHCEPCEDIQYLFTQTERKSTLYPKFEKAKRVHSTCSFELEDFRIMIKLISRCCLKSTIDLKDAYY